VDVFGEPGLAFEVAVRAGESQIVRTHEFRGATAVEEDVLCELDSRLRYEGRALLVRRLSLLGTADADLSPGTRGRCPSTDADPNRVAVRLSEVRVVLDDGKPVLADGHAVLRAPASIANRFAKGRFYGWVGAAVDVRWDAKADLPEVRGKIRGGALAMGKSPRYEGRPEYSFPETFDSEVEITGGEIRARNMHATYGHATVVLESATVRPNDPGVPLHITRVDSRGLRFSDLMEKNDVTRDTVVEWNLDKTIITDFGGTLDPLKLDGDVLSETTGFQVFDRAYHHPARKHMIGVKPPATVHTRFGVRANAVQFMNSRAAFGGSELFTSVVVGFDNRLQLNVGKGSKLRLGDASPIVDIAMDGLAELEVAMNGPASSAPLEGELAIKEFVFAGFPIGDVTSHARFVPLAIELTEVKGQKGHSRFTSPYARIDFNTSGAVLVDGRVRSDRLEIGDFFSMFHFDQDPRFDGIEGRGVVDATVQYDLGGRSDRCGTGYLRVDGRLGMSSLDLFDEHYDSAEVRFDYRWFDQEASYLGMQLDAPSVTLKKGDGTILGNIRMTEGAAVRAHLVGSAVPLSRITSLGDLGRALDGRASAIAEVRGTLDALAADVQAQVSPTRIGRATLPGSDLRISLEPIATKNATGMSKCGRPMPAPYDSVAVEADRADGVYHVSGRVFGEQIKLNDFTITRQKRKRLRGAVAFNKLDLGAIAELSPALALTDQRLDGRVSGKITVNNLSLDDPSLAAASLELDELKLGRGGLVVELARPAKLAIDRGKIPIEGVSVATTVPTGERAVFDAAGAIQGIGTRPRADMTLTLRPTDLSAFARFVPQAERVEGTLAGSLRITGGVGSVVQRGKFTLSGGALAIRGAPVNLTNVNVAVGIEPDEIKILEAKASVGGGTIEMRGGAPLKGFDPGAARVVITARGVNVPLMDGVRAAGDADLELSWQPPRSDSGEPSLPKLSGDVTIGSFRYVRKVTMTADIESLTRRGHRTQFESYDPANDLLALDVRIRASRPLEIDNDLVEAKLSVAEPGLVLSGTNQRFGMRGGLDLLKGGRIRLRRNEFEITQGSVRFDDDERIAPHVDVTAVTDYHRYEDSLGGGSNAAPSGSSGGTSVAAGGRWRITMHAYGDPETLRIDLTSEPALRQDDIFLLLTLGLTRAELDRAQSATAGGSVALEALGRLTGADSAVTETIPVIDEFKLGSAYSSRTGRTEPTVTIGKRLSQRIRAYVTSGLSESREVRSNLQWRLSPRVSVEGSYDNVTDISSSALGNIGTDVRFRLEFE
jgi:translocation and assembly module TamB